MTVRFSGGSGSSSDYEGPMTPEQKRNGWIFLGIILLLVVLMCRCVT